ncbi:uncharacterized protein H6S33_000101 [Morchella sextelata]|uniref:uncharacterized protein n=1 Tax=Morchella sextelata TaxID=1174677 RepID=UPI001D046EF5|nr:uncharacterized protein H6S33_000101 [Morchella sextelata]KAH0614465.1 hypothetical protein H6S33_000101 [Morchella sextelata]
MFVPNNYFFNSNDANEIMGYSSLSSRGSDGYMHSRGLLTDKLVIAFPTYGDSSLETLGTGLLAGSPRRSAGMAGVHAVYAALLVFFLVPTKLRIPQRYAREKDQGDAVYVRLCTIQVVGLLSAEIERFFPTMNCLVLFLLTYALINRHDLRFNANDWFSFSPVQGSCRSQGKAQLSCFPRFRSGCSLFPGGRQVVTIISWVSVKKRESNPRFEKKDSEKRLLDFHGGVKTGRGLCSS